MNFCAKWGYEMKDDNMLVCGHCGVHFLGTASQNKHFKYDKTTPCCSTACRIAYLSNKHKKELPTYGPCPECGNHFQSKYPKTYCSMACYTKSPLLLGILAENNEKKKNGKNTNCLQCNKEFYQKAGSINRKAKRFCNQTCYRLYFMERFDRWVASTESLALPQCYDEFLSKEKLPCLIDGCEWEGIKLAQHANQVHGITAQELKRAAGFNLSTGLIAHSLREKMQGRNDVANLPSDKTEALKKAQEISKTSPTTYRSLEGREHFLKGIAMLKQGSGTERICLYCHNRFIQKYVCGKQLYCSVSCRNKQYRKRIK